ncbi:MAG: hypothetical protein AB7Q17_04750 [Phycisphaerae bacterium]
MRTAVLLAIVALTGVATRADILHLRDGTRHTGTLVTHTKAEIVFRVRIDAGGSTVVRRYAPADVARIERDDGEPIVIPAAEPGAPAAETDASHASATPAASRQSAGHSDGDPAADASNAGGEAGVAPDPTRDSGDWESVAQAALDALRHNGASAIGAADPARVLRRLQRITLRAGAETRARVDERLRRDGGVDLATTLAELRIRAALVRGRGRALRIDFATEIEKPALARLLETRAAELLSRRFAGHALRDWANDPDAYTRLAPDARQMVAAARVAGGLTHARLRFDTRLREDDAERLRLRQLADALARFAARVAQMTGYSSLGESPEPELPAAAGARPTPATATPTPVPVPATMPATRAPGDPRAPAPQSDD